MVSLSLLAVDEKKVDENLPEHLAKRKEKEVKILYLVGPNPPDKKEILMEKNPNQTRILKVERAVVVEVRKRAKNIKI